MVYEFEDADITVGQRRLFHHLTWNIGPGARIGIAGMNGAGKTTLLKALVGQVSPTAGRLVTGTTVKPAYLSQHLEELNPKWRLLEAVEQVSSHIDLGKGMTLSAGQLCERLGFAASAQWTPVGDLSGGERRRLQLTRLLMGEPNVLILDEPTNDFDVETLASLEDLLDSFAGTLLVVSHDRYFLERVCDTFVGVLGDGQVRDLPRGLDEYLELRKAQGTTTSAMTGSGDMAAPESAPTQQLSAAQRRELEKDLGRIERQIKKIDDQISVIHNQMDAHATDFEKIAQLNKEISELRKTQEDHEHSWLELSEKLS